jgi:hypothetical protein
MSEQSQKSRFAIDLDDLERQLRDMQGNETRQPAADPLAELARLVGQDDPLKNVFGAGRPDPAQSAPHYEVPPEDLRGSVDEFDAIFDRHAPVSQPASAQDGETQNAMLDDELARQVLAAIAPEARAEAGHSSAAPQTTTDVAGDPFAEFGDLVSREHARNYGHPDMEGASQPATSAQGGHDAAHDDASFHADAALMGAVAAAAAGATMGRGQAATDSYDEADFAEAPRRSLSKGAITAIALVAVGVVGVGGAAIWRGGKTTDGEPRVIKAEPGPSRVQPQNPGGTEVPDQNKQIYERGGAPKPAETRVVNRDEQPVDVQAAIRNQPRVVFPGGGAGASTEATPPPAASPAAGLGEPRKVRTVAIRPDGTVISAPPAGGTPATSGATPQLTSPQAVTPQSPAPAVSAQPASPAQPAAATSGILRQQAPRTAVPVATAPAAAPVAAQPAAQPVAETPRAVTPAPQQPRPQQQPQRAAAAPAADAPATGGGGFAVQLAAPGSESEARSVFASLQRRFPDELGGQRPQIRKAEVNGREVYRLRVGPMSRESAADLCTRLKGRGGQCFLAGN